ncbi:MAG: hypothetical protein ACJ8FU_08335 [Xanthobacteraceae bacterium]
MAEDQAALVENIYDLTMVANHADSLVSRMEGHASALVGHGGVSPYTQQEANTIAGRLHTIAARLACAAAHQMRPEREAAE